MSYRHGRNKILQVAFALGLVVSGNTTLAHKTGVRLSEAATALATYESRPVEGRLSGGFPHRPFVPLEPANRTRGNNPFKDRPAPPDFLAWMRSTAELFAADAERPTARTRGNLGIAYLYGGYTGAAAQEFERAVTDAPNDPQLLSDLTAAQLALATESGSYEHLLSAVESSGRAVRAEPMAPEAVFNRALALEAMHLTNQARHTWDLYLKLDLDPAWRAEALAHRATLSAPNAAAQWEEAKQKILYLTQAGDSGGVKAIVERFPGLARIYARDELFPEWAEAVIRRDAKTANRARSACQIIGLTLKRLHGDQFLLDAIRAVENAGKAVTTLAKAHLALRNGQSLYDGYDIPSARTKFEQARVGFAGAGDVAFETYAIIGAASCDFHHRRYGETLRAVREVREVARSRAYKNLLARTWWIEGTALVKSGDVRAAAAAYRTAIPIYAESEDWESYSQVSVGLAGSLDILGQTRDAHAHWLNGLKSLSRFKSPYRRVWLLAYISISLARNRRVWLAFDFIREAVETALTAQDARVIPFALFVRAGLYREVGEVGKARADLTKALIYADRCQDEVLRGEMYAYTLLCQGALDMVEDPARALVSFNRACGFLATSRYWYLLEEAHLLRARARRKLRDIDGAEQDLYKAISELKRDRQSFGYSHSLVSFSDPESVYNEMASLQLDDRRRPDLAFLFADASHSPKLNNEAIRLEQTAPAATLEETKKNIPGSVTIVEYVPLADRLLIWIIQSGNSNVIEQPVAGSELETAVKSLRRGIEEATSVPDTLAEAARLYDLLIRPIERLIPESHRVVIVPSGPLSGLPFASLYDAQRHRYFVQAHALSLAPSVRFYLYSTRRAQLFGGRAPSSALVVGNPRLDNESQSDLTSLPGAEAEAKMVAGIYPKTNLLLGPEATKGRFLSEAGEFEVIHFAGHAIANDAPELAALTFASNHTKQGEGGGDRLYARELAGNTFRRTRLVVLAGCRTGQVGWFRTEGVAGLVRPLLAAGIPDVIAALWDVNDSAALPLAMILHQKLRDGASPAEALRFAQLSLIESPNTKLQAPWMWASFQVIGNG